MVHPTATALHEVAASINALADTFREPILAISGAVAKILDKLEANLASLDKQPLLPPAAPPVNPDLITDAGNEVIDDAAPNLVKDNNPDLIENGNQGSPEHSLRPPRGKMLARSISRACF